MRSSYLLPAVPLAVAQTTGHIALPLASTTPIPASLPSQSPSALTLYAPTLAGNTYSASVLTAAPSSTLYAVTCTASSSNMPLCPSASFTLTASAQAFSYSFSSGPTTEAATISPVSSSLFGVSYSRSVAGYGATQIQGTYGPADLESALVSVGKSSPTTAATMTTTTTTGADGPQTTGGASPCSSPAESTPLTTATTTATTTTTTTGQKGGAGRVRLVHSGDRGAGWVVVVGAGSVAALALLL
ncbi:hypothetical protein ANO11243_041200 [Dothideomycetidae sp. 11243]|nr:hypothetical protein ANO11243_041200 [fungal sp. No.11243]